MLTFPTSTSIQNFSFISVNINGQRQQTFLAPPPSHLEGRDVVLLGDVVHGLDLVLVVVDHGDGVAGLAVGLGDRVPLQITGNLRIKIQGDSSED